MENERWCTAAICFHASNSYPPRDKKGQVRADPYRQNLLNLFLARNDPLINNLEEHLLLMNRGNIDWRPLINLWSVLEYLSKYCLLYTSPSPRD